MKKHTLNFLGKALLALVRGHYGDFAAYKSACVETRANPGISTALASLASPLPEIDMDELRKMAPGSFGHALANFVDFHHLRPLVLSAAARSELSVGNILPVRYALLHDAFHVLLGFNASLAGELGVWSFVAEQNYGAGYTRAAKMAGIYYRFLAPARKEAFRRAEARGRRMARQSRILIAEPLEELFKRPLYQVRDMLRIRTEEGMPVF